MDVISFGDLHRVGDEVVFNSGIDLDDVASFAPNVDVVNCGVFRDVKARFHLQSRIGGWYNSISL